MRFHIAMCVRDEGPYLLEWVAYHRSIGATDITIFHNDCSDGTGRMLERLQDMGLVRVVRNNSGRRSPQQRALRRLSAMDTVREADWFIFLDIDEFLNVKCGRHDLASLVDAVDNETDAIVLNWRIFGSGGERELVDRPVTERFFRAGSLDGGSIAGSNGRKMRLAVKTLYRPGRFGACDLHRPVLDRTVSGPGERTWVNGSGKPLVDPEFVSNQALVRLSESAAGIELAQVNHYMVRSRAEWLHLRLRGRGIRPDEERFDVRYWIENDIDDLEDRSIRTDGMREVLADLMRDPKLARLHRRAVRYHRDRVEALRSDPAIARFLDGGAVPAGLA